MHQFKKLPKEIKITPPSKFQKLGPWGESVASLYLQSLGYKLIDKNFRSFFGEVDLICRSGEKIIFVEVKVRSQPWSEGREAIGSAKASKIVKMVNLWLMKHEKELSRALQPQVDCVFIVKRVHFRGQNRKIVQWTLEHLENAFPEF